MSEKEFKVGGIYKFINRLMFILSHSTGSVEGIGEYEYTDYYFLDEPEKRQSSSLALWKEHIFEVEHE